MPPKCQYVVRMVYGHHLPNWIFENSTFGPSYLEGNHYLHTHQFKKKYPDRGWRYFPKKIQNQLSGGIILFPVSI